MKFVENVAGGKEEQDYQFCNDLDTVVYCTWEMSECGCEVAVTSSGRCGWAKFRKCGYLL